ncbi:hypothetical protein AA19596_0927 [Acetobacter fabarum DSM 19596]|nr:hypothetical protein AA19596_0927 [Acetobacter fabarum DSM 19596]
MRWEWAAKAEPEEPDLLLPDYQLREQAVLRVQGRHYEQQDAEPVQQAGFWERTSHSHLLPEQRA